MVARSRWTKPRLVSAAVLFGRGCDAKEIAREVSSDPQSVRKVMAGFGWAFSERPDGNLHVALPSPRLDALEREARRRGRTPEALAGIVLGILATDTILLANVLDDEA